MELYKKKFFIKEEKEKNNYIYHGTEIFGGIFDIKRNILKSSKINLNRWISFASTIKFFKKSKPAMKFIPCIIFEINADKLKTDGYKLKTVKGMSRGETDEIILYTPILKNLKRYCNIVYILRDELNYEIERRTNNPRYDWGHLQKELGYVFKNYKDFENYFLKNILKGYNYKLVENRFRL